jgi:hypothetical protein
MAGGLTLKTSLNGSNYDMERRPKNPRLLEKADCLLISLVHRFDNKFMYGFSFIFMPDRTRTWKRNVFRIPGTRSCKHSEKRI